MSDLDKARPADEEAGTGAPAAGGEGESEGEEERSAPAGRLGHTPAEGATSDEAADSSAAGDDEDVEYVELAKIHNAADVNEARLVKGILETASVPVHLEVDAAETMTGLTGEQLDGIDIFVPVEFASRAKQVLADQGIACGVDPQRAAAFFEERILPAARRDASEAQVASLASDLAKESREFRHDVIARLAALGLDGLESLRALLRAAAHAEESPLVFDVPRVVDEGHFGSKAPLRLAGDLAHLASDPDPKVRRRAAAALGRLRGAGAGATLVTLLSDPDRDVRDEALESLYVLSNGETFDFDPERDPAKQEAALIRWREWARDNPAA